MFQTIQVEDIFDLSRAQVSEEHPAYWLAQLRKADWMELLTFVGVKVPQSTRKIELARRALEHFEFQVCAGRGEVHQAWLALEIQKARGVIVQFRHSETDWSRGLPEFVHPDKGETLGFVNIAARLVCKVR